MLLCAVLACVGLGCGARAGAAAKSPPPDPLEYGDAVVEGHRILAEDPSGSGRVVEVLGDLDGAEHVAVVVPGAGQTRDNFRANPAEPGTVPLANGRALYAAMRDRASMRETAVVVWLGYLPPQGHSLELAGIVGARRGADALVRFTREVLPADAHVTLTCHSYGTAVCGLAAAHANVADDVVALACPGMGVTDGAAIRARVWTTRAPDDWIRWVPSVRAGPVGLGADPMDPGFGAVRFDPGDISGHTQYYRPGSAALAATSAIAVGERAAVASAGPKPR
ncbi:alpha/beta hydrolase [Streptomonospora wellingtoniae]|uniref:Alpha/beta hydrolase n=1 Tax=Streptomonospora wellingtoniae TaxID=3075544 RepID=A0ABU2KQE1_9ACTN|nr:alpha/beta hydrolase [Streptomonospora sp. DSM 45055]MDT0301502.1 alpha/beta hydrolase [Streptomonospora sp. DSM 45055]